jgi:hypothetical protein
MMDRKRKFAMIAATFFLAAATGQYMQSNAPRRAALQVPHVVARMAPMARAARFTPPSARPVPVLPSARPVALDLPQDAGTRPIGLAAAEPSCTPKLRLSPAPAAMLRLSLDAPCNASERVVIHADGLAFTALTSDQGRLTLALPAMHDPAKVAVRLAGGARATATAAVPALAGLSRVAVQWMGRDAFRIDALEFGAGFGTPGDVSPDNPRGPDATDGGFLTDLGDASVPRPMRAEVYTVPKARTTGGKVEVLVQAPVTPGTCGRDLLGQMLTAGAAAPADVTLAMPACDPASTGQFVALPGLAPVLQVASR